MTPTTYQKPEIRDSNDNIIQQGAFGKNTALSNATNDGWIDYVANDLEALNSNKASLASPAFSGNPTAPTQATNNNSTRLATTAFVTNDLKANTMLLADTFATAIQSGDDLNDYKTAGTYISSSQATTDSLTNCPVTSAGFKLVVTYGGYGSIAYCGRQIVFAGAEKIFIRKWTGNSGSGSWDEWKSFAFAENVLPLSGGTLTGRLYSKSTLTFLNSGIDKGTNPSATQYPQWIMTCDKNGNEEKNRICGCGGIVDVVGGVNYGLFAYKYQADSNSSESAFVTNPLTGDPSFRPGADNNMTLGRVINRWKQLYAGTTTIATSDERLKDNIAPISDEVLDAWGEVGWYQYQFKDAVAEKGEKARLHTGAIAQRIESVFKAHDLDANRYGLLCYDEWSATPSERDEDGNIVQEAQPAGNRYSLRYEEALCMEAAYQRRRADRLEERIARLEALMRTE